jgi:glyoxylase-like metal-dependent hydrolase (beta-lactamase superfamily II)
MALIEQKQMKILHLHHTNYFLVENKNGKFLSIDNGYPCTLYEYKRKVKEAGINFEDIIGAIVTHLHLDHAGLLGELCQVIPDCYLIGNQRQDEINEMERIILRDKNYAGYKKIDLEKIKFISIDEMNTYLEEKKFGGTIIATPSHSKDSVTYITDDGTAIIGDLTPLCNVMEDNKEENEDWNKLFDLNVKNVIPSHANEF